MEPPLNEISSSGGPGDVITIERVDDGNGNLNVEYLRRGCDHEGYWQELEPFKELARDIKKNDNNGIIPYLTIRTVEEIKRVIDPEIFQDNASLQITVIKYSPNKKVGLGLGSSASSTAVVLGLDHLYGNPLRVQEDQKLKSHGRSPFTRLRLMAEGEQLVSGERFFDNVAPLAVEGGLIGIETEAGDLIDVAPLPWPRGLYFVTVTPNFALETIKMRAAVSRKTINCIVASEAAHKRAEVMRGLYESDLDRIIRFAGDGIVEEQRWSLIFDSDALRRHVAERRNLGFPVSIGISGSGPTIYCLASSRESADQIGQELREIWKSHGMKSWCFVHDKNDKGARIIHCS